MREAAEYRDDPEQWVMIVTATGRAFCTGMYVDEGAEKTAAKGKADGMVTARERARLHRLQNAASKDIRHQKHDAQVAPRS